MSSFRDLIKASSGLGEGVALRTHLLNLGSGVGGDVYVGGDLTMSIEPSMSMNTDTVSLTMDIGQAMTMDLETSDLSVNITDELSMEN